MSYILDALRRADAERRRGQAPALQQVAAPLTASPGPHARPASRAWPAMAVLALLALVVAGWWWGRSEPGRAPTAAPPPPPPAALSPVAPAAAPVVAAPAAPAAVVAPPAPAAPVAVTPPPAPAPPKPRPARTATEARIASPPPSPVAASTAPPRPIAASALPEPQRSVVARLAFGGAVHSQDRSQSFVLVGGQIVHEGATLAPGIVLERIQPRSLLLRVDGRAVEVAL
jgi:general secretion pathway protein B